MSANKVMERYQNRGTLGITAPEAAPAAPVKLTLVDATTGITVARGIGAPANVTSGAAPGIYILIEDNGTTRTITKIVK